MELFLGLTYVGRARDFLGCGLGSLGAEGMSGISCGILGIY